MLDSGESARRLARWIPSKSTITTEIAKNGDLGRSRCRDAVRNTAWGAKANTAFAGALVGTGIHPAPTRLAASKKKALVELYGDWTDEADADGLTDFQGMQAVVARELLPAGECFVRRRPRFSSDGLVVPLQLQLLQSEMLPFSKNELLGNGNEVRFGIEFDRLGRRVAYHFLRRHPGDISYLMPPAFADNEFVRVPAEDVIHVFDPLEIGQVRGMPGMTAALVRMHETDRYVDAQLARQHIAALFAGFIRPGPDGVDPFSQQEASDDDVEDLAAGGVRPEGWANIQVEPGTFWTLRPGEEIDFPTLPAIGGDFEPFIYRVALDVSAALGVPYSLLTGDVRAANYSSERAARIGFRQHIEQMQHKVIVHQLCRGVWKWFLDAVVLSGALSLPGYARNPAKYTRVRWVTPKWEWVDPLDDIKAEQEQVKAGFKARSDVIEALGYDAEETDAKIAADKAREKALGLDFSENPAAAKPAADDGGQSAASRDEEKGAGSNANNDD